MLTSTITVDGTQFSLDSTVEVDGVEYCLSDDKQYYLAIKPVAWCDIPEDVKQKLSERGIGEHGPIKSVNSEVV